MAGISKKKVKTKKGEIIKYTITYYDIFGKQHTSGIYDTIKEAKKHLSEFENNNFSDKSVKVGFIVEEFIKSRKQKERATNTIRSYEDAKKKLIEYFEIDYKKISALKWQEILYKIKKETSPYVAQGCYRLLNAAFGYCEKYKIIADNPFKIVEAIELPEIEHNHFEIEELLRLLAICQKVFPEYYVLFFTFVASGMREGEIFGLLKKNVDFINHRICVCTQFTNGEFKEKTKTKTSKRFVYMFPSFEAILEEYIEKDKTESELVFHNSKGNFLSQSNIRNRFWVKLLEIAGYPRNYARLHDLRGSNTDVALELGLSITYAKDNLGHSTASTTLKHYAKSNKAMISEAMEKFEQAFNTKKCEQNMSKKENGQNAKIIKFPKRNWDVG